MRGLYTLLNYYILQGQFTVKFSFPFILFFILNVSAFGADDFCRDEVKKFCGDETDRKKIILCLSQKMKEVSVLCKEQIERFGKTVRQTTPPGGGPMGLLGGMTGTAVPMLSYEGRFQPSDYDNDTGTTDNQLRLAYQWLQRENYTFGNTLAFSEYHFNEGPVLDSGTKIPSNLKRTDLGFQYNKILPNQRRFGLQTSFGYSGDKFNSDTQTYSVSSTYAFPGKEGNWVLLVMVSNNSPLGPAVPIPGFFYVKRTPTFTGVFGLPILSMQWTPKDLWSFSLTALGPLISGEISHGSISEIQYFFSTSWSQQRFILTDREEDRDRLTIEEKKLELGLRLPLHKNFFVEGKIGRSFDRQVYIGRGLFDKEKGQTRLDASYIGTINLKFLFQ
jgi:hypothetical protein